MTELEVSKAYPIGARVKRGPSWKWYEQDCDKHGTPTEGVIEKYNTGMSYYYDGKCWWIRVQWTCGGCNAYRIDPFYDVVCVSSSSIAPNSGPRNNDGRGRCFWCDVPTQKRGGGAYDICPTCGK